MTKNLNLFNKWPRIWISCYTCLTDQKEQSITGSDVGLGLLRKISHSGLYSTVPFWYYVLYCSTVHILYSTVLILCIVLFYSILYSTVLILCIVLFYSILYSTVLILCIVLFYSILYSTVLLLCIVLFYSILYVQYRSVTITVMENLTEDAVAYTIAQCN